MRVLCGDIGGTNTRLAIEDNGHRVAVERVINADHHGLVDIVAAFMKRHGPVRAACLGVPVRCPEAGQGRHEDDTATVRDRCRQGFDFR